MERRMKVADFAALIGVVPKTVYKMIEREEIMTVNEKVNNRSTTLIVTTDEQIEELKKSHGKDTVNDGNCYENVTVNNRSMDDINSQYTEKINNNNIITAEVIDRIITLNEGYNEQLKEVTEKLFAVNDELVEVKSQTLLLEDKAGREGFYLNEINQLKNSNKRLMKFIYLTVTVIVFLLLSLTGYVTYNVSVNNRSTIEEYSVTENAQKNAGQAQEAVKPLKPARK